LNQKFKEVVQLFRKLPGVGPRQAARFILALMERDEVELTELGNAIINLKKNIKLCKECFNLSENLPDRQINGLCYICSDPRRDRTKLMVLEKVTDLDSMEKLGIYKGTYHVLGGAINPLNGAVPETLRFKELERRLTSICQEHNNIELIIATNPTTTGETTALYIRDTLKDKPGITLTRLGRGLASGSNLEYADEITLKHALEQRR